jgi:hypothetical protein
MKYAFISAEAIVVNVVDGILSDYEASRLLADYVVLFGAKDFVVVASDVSVWIGGSYDSASGTFTPPPTPEPEPIVVDAPIASVEEILPE